MEPAANGAFATLQHLLRKRPQAVPGTVCDYCTAPICEGHGHLVDLQARRILCACRPCYLVFQPHGAAQGRYRPVPTRYRELDVTLADPEWEALQIPISLAFFFYSSAEQRVVAFYPGPAGATESQLPLERWVALTAERPALAQAQPDVEAILFHRTPARTRCFLIPIDAAYELVGLMRTVWRGFDGGAEAWARIEAYFAQLRERSRAAMLESP